MKRTLAVLPLLAAVLGLKLFVRGIDSEAGDLVDRGLERGHSRGPKRATWLVVVRDE